MNESRLTYLFWAYFNKTATPYELNELMTLLAQTENDVQVKALLTEAWQQFRSQGQPFSDSEGEEMLAGILREGATRKPARVIAAYKRPSGWLRVAAAAAVLFFVFAGAYFWLNHKQSGQPTAQVKKVPANAGDIIVPGRNKAVLTLADGSSIALDSTRQGMLAKQGNAKVVKLNTATLAYNTADEKNREIVYNTLSTPSGGQYQLVLPDGTRVWLNAASSIHFPTLFKKGERSVTLTGEAYFEVAKDASSPFRIKVKDVEIQVLGTHFNIMAYDDESSINTTLLEGSVKVFKGSSSKVLAPGQESRIGAAGDIKVVNADIEEVMAWKNGWFQFNAYDIQKVMRQISRWYDVEIVYEGQIPAGHFSGLVSRANDISQVLKIIQAGGVRFRIEGRKVIVLS